jgi:predicted negative regulator of RcsB-dependent stress response
MRQTAVTKNDLLACLFAGREDNSPPFMDAQTQSTDVSLRILEWLHARRKLLVIGVVAAAVLGLAFGFMAWKKAQDETDANAQIFAVPVEGGMRSMPVSPQPLLEVAREYPGTVAGEYAQLLAADLLFNLGKYPEAGQQFSEYIDNHPESALIPQAKVGVAASLEAQGKTSEAITKYHELVMMYPSEMNIVSPAKLTLARLYDEDNKPELAFNLYVELTRLLNQNPYDPWASEARERAQLLVAKHPELLKSQASAAPSSAPPGFSVSEPAQAADSAAPAPPSSPAATPLDNKGPKLLTIPGASSNSTGKP